MQRFIFYIFRSNLSSYSSGLADSTAFWRSEIHAFFWVATTFTLDSAVKTLPEHSPAVLQDQLSRPFAALINSVSVSAFSSASLIRNAVMMFKDYNVN
jgi:hypothetical protein